MNIGSMCKRETVSIDHGMNLHQAAQLMRDAHVGALVVTSTGPSGTAVLGVVTDRDLAIEVLARGRDGASVSIGTLVSGKLAAVSFDGSPSDAIAAMEAEGVRRLLVTGAQQELIGVVSIDDLLEVWAEDMARLSKSLRKARERESRDQLPALTIDGLALAASVETTQQAWQQA